jgi:hypothetical protein
MSTRTTVFGLIVLLAAAASPAFAQPAGGRGDPAQFRQRMSDRLKELLGANDDEWKALEPKVFKVMDLQREANSGGRGMGMLMGRGGPGGGGGAAGGGGAGAAAGGGGRGFGGDPNAPPSAVMEKTRELQTTLENKDAKPDDLKAKLKALREARAKAKADLAKAQDDLRDLLTARQESALVMLGMLE